MRRQVPWIRCASSLECGGDDERHIRALASRSEAIHPVASADRGLAGATASIPAGARVRTRPGLSEVWKRQLRPVHRARNGRDDDSLHLYLFWSGAALRPAARSSQGDAGGPGAADHHHDWPDAGWGHGGGAAGLARLDRLPGGRIPPGQPGCDPRRILLYDYDRHGLRRAGDGDRFGAQGYTGIPADHEFYRHAHVLSVGGALSIDQHSQTSWDRDQRGSSVVWD